jgi:hypothetical protein
MLHLLNDLDQYRSVRCSGHIESMLSKVFLAHGFSAAATDMVQREAGVSKSTVYAHYANPGAYGRTGARGSR